MRVQRKIKISCVDEGTQELQKIEMNKKLKKSWKITKKNCFLLYQINEGYTENKNSTNS